jgi:nucleotide-binding universal stress UspA family protein
MSVFRQILVPLDGSILSEASLAPAALLADRFDACVTLLHVIEKDAPEEVHHDRHLTTARAAQEYLEATAASAFSDRTTVRTHVHDVPVSDVALGIVEHAVIEFKADLIITCTHGRGGVRDLIIGSIAQRVVAQGRLPLLLIKPVPLAFDVKRILVPLDPDSVHDHSLEPSAVLALALPASLELLSVVPTTETQAGEEAVTSLLMPITAQAVLQLREEQAGEHLQQHVEALQERGLAASSTVVRGEPAAQILRASEGRSIDLIVLSTHRKAGLGAFWSKSVAPRVAQAAKKPVLLMPLE